MRATYEKVSNTIIVELSQEEATKYCAQEISENDESLRAEGKLYFLTIPCGDSFYQMTQRQRGGSQSWGPDELRTAIRSAVANKFVVWDNPTSQDAFRDYKSNWNEVFQGLLRNVRLKFPTGKYPRGRLSREEFEYRRQWRRQFVS
jgi:hypothetical protein